VNKFILYLLYFLLLITMFKQIDLELYQFIISDFNDSNIFFKLHFLNKGLNKNNIVYDWLRKIIMKKLTKIGERVDFGGNKHVIYLLNGKRHNENGPANISYNKSGNKKIEKWYIDGKLHNENGPEQIWYNENGNIHREFWYINGKKHNENSPAYISYWRNGNVFSQYWYKDGKKHNLSGPAIISYLKNGNIQKKYWYINDEELTEEEFNKLKIE
jgi:antitoxin component YwqK of YwqJK toxin-antitoxin module